jgi:cobalt/nickel transport system permease protein
MNNINKNILHIGKMDTLAAGGSALHRLDPRAKLVVTFIFLVVVASFDKHTIAALLPFVLFPVTCIALGGLPFGYIFRALLLASPFAIAMAIFNPFIDRQTLLHIGTLDISGGWVSFFSIILRFVLTVSAVLALVALTGFNAVCEALLSFGVPKPFIVQLQLFSRYMFLLADEAGAMVQARSVRSFNKGPMAFGLFAPLIGHLLLRTLDRADRIYRSMCCRGFNGHIAVIGAAKIGRLEITFVVAWTLLFLVFRFVNVPQLLGAIILGATK